MANDIFQKGQRIRSNYSHFVKSPATFIQPIEENESSFISETPYELKFRSESAISRSLTLNRINPLAKLVDKQTSNYFSRFSFVDEKDSSLEQNTEKNEICNETDTKKSFYPKLQRGSRNELIKNRDFLYLKEDDKNSSKITNETKQMTTKQSVTDNVASSNGTYNSLKAKQNNTKNNEKRLIIQNESTSNLKNEIGNKEVNRCSNTRIIYSNLIPDDLSFSQSVTNSRTVLDEMNSGVKKRRRKKRKILVNESVNNITTTPRTT